MRRLPLLLLVPVLAVIAALPSAAATAPLPLTVKSTFLFSKAGGEPNVTISPDGRGVLADGLGSGTDPANLFASSDGGVTFTKKTGYIPSADTGGGDWDMHWLSNSVVIAADLGLDAGVFVHVSEDAGKTWRTTQIQTDVYDRPWIVGRGNDVYVTMKGFDAVPYVFVSHDLAKTFSQIPIITYGGGTTPAEVGGGSPTPVDALVTNQNAYVDSMVIDPRNGTVYILYGIDGVSTYPSHPPLGAPNRLYVAKLEREANPTVLPSYPVYLGGSTDAFYAGFNWLTIDKVGTLYALGNGQHAGHQSAWMASSKDGGKSWTALTDLGTAGVASVFGAIDPVSPGVLSLAYYEGTKADANTAQDWFATMAVVGGADTTKPVITHRQRVVTKAVHQKDICLDGLVCGLPGFGNNRALLDYIDNEVGPDGSMWGVFASTGPASEGATGTSTILVRLLPLTQAATAGTSAAAPLQTVTTVRSTGAVTVRKARQPSVTAPHSGLAATGLPTAITGVAALLLLSGAVVARRRRA